MKIRALVTFCDEFLYARIIEICCQSTESAFNHLHFFIATHVCAAQRLIKVCQQVKITWSQVWTVGWKKTPHASVMRKWSLLSGQPSYIKVPVLN
jgi:hypothetical protein